MASIEVLTGKNTKPYLVKYVEANNKFDIVWCNTVNLSHMADMTTAISYVDGLATDECWYIFRTHGEPLPRVFESIERLPLIYRGILHYQPASLDGSTTPYNSTTEYLILASMTPTSPRLRKNRKSIKRTTLITRSDHEYDVYFPPGRVRFIKHAANIDRYDPGDMGSARVSVSLLDRVDIDPEEGTNKEGFRMRASWRYLKETMNIVVSGDSDIIVSQQSFRPTVFRPHSEVSTLDDALVAKDFPEAMREVLKATSVNNILMIGGGTDAIAVAQEIGANLVLWPNEALNQPTNEALNQPTNALLE